MKRIKKSFIMLLTFVFLCGIGTLAYINEKNKITKSIPREISFDTETEVSDASANTVVKETKEPVFEKKEEPAAEASTENVPEKIVFAYPAAGAATETFHIESLSYSKTMGDFRTHSGIDFSSEQTEDVYACADGTVKEVFNDTFMGLSVCIDHGNGIESEYSSLSECFVNNGDAVTAGSVLGKSGDTASIEKAEGYHVHLEVKKNGVSVNPEEFFN